MYKDDDVEIRFRKLTYPDNSSKYTKTIKIGRGIERQEFEFEVSRLSYRIASMNPLKTVSKLRYKCKYKGTKYDIDVYYQFNKLNNLFITAEVELDNKDSEFSRLPCILKEVTGLEQFETFNIDNTVLDYAF